MDFNKAKTALQKAFDQAKKNTISGESGVYDAKWFKRYRVDQWDGGQAHFRESEVYYLEVEPKDYKPVVFAGKNFGGQSEWTEFKFWADRDDHDYSEGAGASYSSKSPGAARKLFKILKADPDAVKRMDLKAFQALLEKSKVGYRYNPSVWR